MLNTYCKKLQQDARISIKRIPKNYHKTLLVNNKELEKFYALSLFKFHTTKFNLKQVIIFIAIIAN